MTVIFGCKILRVFFFIFIVLSFDWCYMMSTYACCKNHQIILKNKCFKKEKNMEKHKQGTLINNKYNWNHFMEIRKTYIHLDKCTLINIFHETFIFNNIITCVLNCFARNRVSLQSVIYILWPTWELVLSLQVDT